MLSGRGSKELERFRSRAPLSDAAFLERIALHGEPAETVCRTFRAWLGKIFRVPPQNIYPADAFDGNLARLPCWEFDIVEVILWIEDAVGQDLGDERADPLGDLRRKTVGEWLIQALPIIQAGQGAPGEPV